MPILLFVAGLLMILVVLVDAFEMVVLPRRVASRFRLTAFFSRTSWRIWKSIARRLSPGRNQQNFLAFFGPLALILLLLLWDIGLVVGFSLLITSFTFPTDGANKLAGFDSNLFTSAITFLSVGLARPVPPTFVEKLLLVGEGALGLAFLALVIGYLPQVYDSFASREVMITLLDARAGSPPTAFEVLRRCGEADECEAIQEYLANWEDWTADLLETHLSYPVLAFYRSQHENQSWLAALAVILDTSALVSIGIEGISKRQGRLTFAMARHALVDLSQVYGVPPHDPVKDRLPKIDYIRMENGLADVGICFETDADTFHHLEKVRQLYEPYLSAIAEHLLMPIPDWMPEEGIRDNWESTAWGGSGRVRL